YAPLRPAGGFRHTSIGETFMALVMGSPLNTVGRAAVEWAGARWPNHELIVWPELVEPAMRSYLKVIPPVMILGELVGMILDGFSRKEEMLRRDPVAELGWKCAEMIRFMALVAHPSPERIVSLACPNPAAYLENYPQVLAPEARIDVELDQWELYSKALGYSAGLGWWTAVFPIGDEWHYADGRSPDAHRLETFDRPLYETALYPPHK